FTLGGTSRFQFRFASLYKAQAAILSPSQVDNFRNFAAFNSFVVFDQQLGTQSVTLPGGSYVLGVRNLTADDNEYSFELDYEIADRADKSITPVGGFSKAESVSG